MKQESENKQTAATLLKDSIIKVDGLSMELVPYSIAVQALTMEKANTTIGNVTEQLDQLNSIGEELERIYKQYDKK